MSAPTETAAGLVAGALARRRPEERGRLLRELMAHAAAGLVVIEGEAAASESVYRLADAVVSRACRP